MTDHMKTGAQLPTISNICKDNGQCPTRHQYNHLINSESDGVWEEIAVTHFKILPLYSPEGFEENLVEPKTVFPTFRSRFMSIKTNAVPYAKSEGRHSGNICIPNGTTNFRGPIPRVTLTGLLARALSAETCITGTRSPAVRADIWRDVTRGIRDGTIN
jgi:hypothetical protein